MKQTHILVAAAVPVGSIVNLPPEVTSVSRTILITDIENATPRPGRIIWIDEEHLEVEIGAATKVEVVSFP